jgi:hypothetical protein
MGKPSICIACLLLILAAGTTLLALKPAGAGLPEPMSLVFRDDFAQGDEHWQPTDPAAWKIESIDDLSIYRRVSASKYQPKFRSPYNIALVRDVFVGDFQLDVKLRSTKRDYDHRDLCLIFGYQDPDHFYYVHFGKKTDDHANQIFIVNGAARVKISTQTTAGTPWDDAWHQARVVRNAADGTIEVYFDDLEKPTMTAKDTTFTWGQVGVGSFDDTGDFDVFELRGTLVDRPADR